MSVRGWQALITSAVRPRAVSEEFGPKSAFLVILGQILPFFAHFVQCPTKNNVNKVSRWVFRYVGRKGIDTPGKRQRRVSAFSSQKKLDKKDQSTTSQFP